MAAAQKAYPEAMINRNTVSGVLFRYKDKRVRVVEEGRGRRAAIYEGIV